MNLRPVVLLCALAVVPLFGRPKLDAIVMKNGDRFTTEIKKLENGVLYAGMDYVDGTVSIQWSKVAHVESPQLFLVHTQDGSIYQGTLKTAATAGQEPVKIEIEESPKAQELVEQRQIVGVVQSSESFWRSFSGSIDSGLIYTRGNNTTQYNLGSELKYLRERWSADATYSSSLSLTDPGTLSTRNQTNLQALRLMRWNNWFYLGVGSFLQSSQQNIKLQSSVGGGVGRFLKNTNRTRISLTSALAWQNTKYNSAVQPSQQSAAAIFGGNVQWFVFKKTNLSLAAAATPILNQPGRVRTNVNGAYSIQIINNLWWKLSFYGNWDNRPPTHLSGSDYGSSSGITYTFN
jgi:hypothetical protein